MTFTDEDLKRLKEHGPEWELSYEKLAVLIARLEAAEKLIDNCDGCQDCNPWGIAKDLWLEWRKAAGK